MQTFTVKNIEEKQTKDGSKTFFIITDTTGASFSLWEPIGMIKPGCILEADIQVKGKYNNIQDFKITTQPSATPIPEASKQAIIYKDNPDQRQSIESQVAAKIVSELVIAGKVSENEPLARSLFSWCQSRLPKVSTIPSSTPETKAAAPPKAESSTQQPTKPLPASHSEVQRKLNKIIHENIWTVERAIKELVERGGVGKDSLEKIKSLKPDKLQELNQAIENVLKPELD